MRLSLRNISKKKNRIQEFYNYINISLSLQIIKNFIIRIFFYNISVLYIHIFMFELNKNNNNNNNNNTVNEAKSTKVN